MTLTFGSLFAGIGGIDLGLERASMHCMWQVEIDPFCRRVLAKHWPDVPRYEDVRDVGRHNLEAVDLVAGGFPCQPHSVAGKQRGARDDRNLWPEFSRIIAELRPRYVLAENVPGIITTYLDTVLSDLEHQGYTWAAFNLPAVAFGAPHRRERIFVVAHTAGTRCNGRHRSDEHERQHDTVGRGEQPCGDGGHGSMAHAASGERSQSQARDRRQVLAGGIEKSRGDRPWASEPRVCRVADGVPHRVDRLRGLGNAVLPQIAEWIGHRIVAVEMLLAIDSTNFS